MSPDLPIIKARFFFGIRLHTRREAHYHPARWHAERSPAMARDRTRSPEAPHPRNPGTPRTRGPTMSCLGLPRLIFVGQLESVLAFPKSRQTGPDGTAALMLKAGDPGRPRHHIDDQVYGV